MTIKAIETEYNGYKFRSRLEARWAVFFDAAGIEYQYEPEGVETSDGDKYLPDFYLPELETYVEVKGKRPGYEQEILRLPKFIEWGGQIKQILILSDVPGKTEDGGIWHFPALYWNGLGVDYGWFFFSDGCDCIYGHVSKANYIRPHITEWSLKQGRFSIDPKSDYSKDMRNITEPMIINGYQFPTSWERNENVASALLKARQARFEHGETPVIHHE